MTELEKALKKIEEMGEKIEGMGEKIELLNGEAKTHRLGKKKVSDELAKFEGIDLDEIKALKKKASDLEKERLKSEGKFEEALAEATKTLTAENEDLRTKLTDKDSLLSNALIDTAVLSAIDGKAINNDQLLSLIKPGIKMVDGVPIPMNGEVPAADDKGKKLSVAEFAIEFLNKNPHFVKADGGGAGSGGNTGGNNKGEKTMLRSDFDAMTDPAAKATFFKEGGKVVDPAE